MKVIELLTKIANGEEVPDRISFCSYDYKWDKDFDDYLRIEDKQQMPFSFIENHNDNLEYFLNDTVDTIEEDKKIEKLTHLNNVSNASDLVAISQMQWENNSLIERKINEIIDYINKE